MSESFLKESWEHTAEREKNEPSREEVDVELYFDIRERCQNDPDLKAAMERLDHEISSYTQALLHNEHEWLQFEQGIGEKESVESSDRHRYIAHNALIDSLNQLSRLFRAKKLDNKWRNVLGLDRSRIATWAMTIMRHVLKKEEL